MARGSFLKREMLVTGGAGFIGSNFIRFAQRADPHIRIHNLDALTYAGSRENLVGLPDPDRHHLIQADICDQARVEELLRDKGIRSIVHFAAESHVDRSIAGPAPFIQTNIVGTFALLEAARRVWLEEAGFGPEEVRFHHVSTDEVYGSLGPEDPPLPETAPYSPNSPYAASKAASDHLVRAYAHTYGLPVTVSNCSNNYGPYQLPEKLIPLVIGNAVSGKSLPLYGDGRQVRDWLYVGDHCSALWRILQEGRPGLVYHIAGGNQPTNEELVRRICSLLDDHLPDSPHRPHEKLITHVQDRPGHDRRYALDTAKIESELGWIPSESMDSGLHKTVMWYLDHEDWIRAIERRPSFQAWLALNYGKREPSR